VAQLAAWLGTYGLSGITALIAGMLLLLALRHWREVSAVAGTVAVATGLALAISPAAPAPTATALRIVQPNISQADKWREGFDAEVLRRLVGLSAGGSTAGAGQRVLLWPEVAVTEPLQDARGDPIYQGNAAWTLSQVQGTLAPGELLLTGGLAINSRDGVRASGATNSVFGIERNRGILARYDKAHLVPYGEYLPMRPILSAIGLSRLAPGDLDTDPGPGPQTLTLPIVGKVGFQLCYEVIFSGEVLDRENRPNFLFNPSNDAWFGAWGPPQHLAQARLRALEEGMPVLRSTPTGISAVIDARGELLQSLPWRKPGVIDALLPAPLPPTLFARVGNLLPLVFALLLAAGAMLVGRQARAIAEEDEAR
jgi:apolipoprotein N-acyltransferase